MATRILSHRGLLSPAGRVALLVGSEVVYLGGRGAGPATMTPYDVCALRLADATVLAGDPPDDADRYLAALRSSGMRAAALGRNGDEVAPDVITLVERMSAAPWSDVEADARASGALIGAYPSEA